MADIFVTLQTQIVNLFVTLKTKIMKIFGRYICQNIVDISVVWVLYGGCTMSFTWCGMKGLGVAWRGVGV